MIVNELDDDEGNSTGDERDGDIAANNVGVGGKPKKRISAAHAKLVADRKEVGRLLGEALGMHVRPFLCLGFS